MNLQVAVFVALLLLFVLAMVTSFRTSRTRVRPRAEGMSALDPVWEFLHEPKESDEGNVASVEGELPDGRKARVSVDVTLEGAPVSVKFALPVIGAQPFSIDADSWRTGRAAYPELPFPKEKQGLAHHALTRLFETLELESVRVVDGELVATGTWDTDRSEEWVRALQLLNVIARILDPPRELEREVHLGKRAHGAVRCSYCHGDLAPADESAPCERCGTVLHVGCWQELGRCPVLGCEGKSGERERVR